MMKHLILFISLLVGLTACEKAFFQDEVSSDAVTTFDYLWKEVDENYSYFEVKQVNWDDVYDVYRPQVSKEMSEDSLFQVMARMLNELRDGHVNITSYFNVSFFDINSLGPDQFTFRTITDHYLPSNYYVSGPFIHDFLLGENIGYVRFASFDGEIDNLNLDFVLNRYQNANGLIIDLRENGGGTPTDMFALLGRFTDIPRIVYRSRIKSGADHNDFSDVIDVTLTPSENVRYSKPVVMLTDRGTYSAGSFTALATKALTNITLVGDTTGGGLGLPNGGQLPNGWAYRMSVTQTLTLDGDPSYENGVPPDVRVDFDFADLTTDEILEEGIRLLK